jgi:pyruvate/2-oxoglutarate dehydrogenase complex dihydrolipoamide acyltransferase (E2) component
MPTFPIRIPKVSSAAFDATVVEFIVNEGETVNSGDPLFSIETEKVETEIEAARTGVVHWTGEVGEVYEIGTEIGHIDADSEE